PWPGARPLADGFFDRDAQLLARELLGKVIRHRVDGRWVHGALSPIAWGARALFGLDIEQFLLQRHLLIDAR
ncbi:hypothetical protein R0G64_32000, partial [Pseudomonas otitidis]|nr:hypothetical protein [Pseudomonas otitidis]